MARISEMHYSNAYAASSGVPEFLEVALGPGEDPADFTAAFYDRDGTLILEVPLTDPGVQVFVSAEANETLYVIQQGPFDIFLTDPDGGGATNAEAYALVNTATNEVVDFYDIGGGTQNITALEGPAQGAVSVNVPVPTGPNQATYSIQFNQPDTGTVAYETVDPGGAGVICFAAGTAIRTPLGDIAVESLRPGDLVETLDHGAQPLRWTGMREVAAQGALAPVAIAAGVLGNARTLVLSPQHRVLVTGWRAQVHFGAAEVLVPAIALVDGESVVRRTGGTVAYHHLLFDRHEIVFAEGAPAESFHPGHWGMGQIAPEQREELLALFPELAGDPAAFGPAARPALSGREASVIGPLAFAGPPR